MAKSDDGRLPCDACASPATHLVWRNLSSGETRSLRVCSDHNRLAEEYRSADIKLPGAVPPEVDNSKKTEWLRTADKVETHEVAEDLMSKDRGGQFHTRQLTHREKYPNDDPSISRGLGR